VPNFLSYFRRGEHKTLTFLFPFLHFPVYGRVHDHASLDYPGIYHRSTLCNGYCPILESRTLSLVMPPSILGGEALIALLALLYARVVHSSRHEYAL
jgi:hypothetical protein